MTFTFYFSPEPIFTGNYSFADKRMISEALWFSQFVLRNQLEPLIGAKVGTVFKNLKIEFVSKRDEELIEAGAVGLAYRDRNKIFMPSKLAEGWKKNNRLDRLAFLSHTGVLTMEETHSVVWRLGSLPEFKNKAYTSGQLANDLIHWLYNEGRLIVKDCLSPYPQYFGRKLQIVIPDLAYGWKNRAEIMEGIKTGRYKEGKNKYWSDSASIVGWDNRIYSTRHEIEHIKRFLIGY